MKGIVMKLAIFAAPAVVALAVASCPTAQAAPAAPPPPPPPSGSDVSSYGKVGTPTMGGSLGKDGYSVNMGQYNLTSEGWPVSHTQVTGPGMNYQATTDYNSQMDGSVEHWSSLRTMPNGANFDNHVDAYYNGQSTQEVQGNIGTSTFQLTCTNGMCTH